MLKLHVIASGSGGNASVVADEATGRGLLIDGGITKKAFFEGVRACGFDCTGLEAVLVTHDHSDHTKGLGVILRGLAKMGVRVPVLTGARVAAASQPLREAAASVDAPVRTFEAGRPFSAAGLKVLPFATSHDAAESFGFCVAESGDGDRLGFMTDTGVAPEEALKALRGTRLLALEFNHDAAMLEKGPYPYMLKKRIASERGHLSNDQASCALRTLIHDDLQAVCAMHVSRENNTYPLAKSAVARTLDQAGNGAAALVAYQEMAVTLA